MSRQETSLDNAPGQDSFLDIVANLVGILIILVMVVGVRAKDALLKGIDQPSDGSLEKLERQVESEQKVAQAIETDITRDMAAKLMQQQLEVQSRTAERDHMLVVITAAKRLLAQRRGELDTAGQKAFDLNRKLAEARTELRLLENSRRVAEDRGPPVVIEHRPTPLAKTVRTREIFFRLMHGRLVYVPKEELEELMVEDMRVKVAKLRTQRQVIETVGPIRGFRLRYVLKMKSYVLDSGFGPSERVGPAFDHYALIAESDQIGEPLEVALRSDSLFRRELARALPGTTVTVWVYPEDFGHFRQLKDEVYKLGFLTASWPMPEGEPIEASPEGSRSVVQ